MKMDDKIIRRSYQIGRGKNGHSFYFSFTVLLQYLNLCDLFYMRGGDGLST